MRARDDGKETSETNKQKSAKPASNKEIENDARVKIPLRRGYDGYNLLRAKNFGMGEIHGFSKDVKNNEDTELKACFDNDGTVDQSRRGEANQIRFARDDRFIAIANGTKPKIPLRRKNEVCCFKRTQAFAKILEDEEENENVEPCLDNGGNVAVRASGSQNRRETSGKTSSGRGTSNEIEADGIRKIPLQRGYNGYSLLKLAKTKMTMYKILEGEDIDEDASADAEVSSYFENESKIYS